MFDEMLMMVVSALYNSKTLSCVLILLGHCYNSPQVEMSHHLNTLCGLCTNLAMLLLMFPSRELQTIAILQILACPDR